MQLTPDQINQCEALGIHPDEIIHNPDLREKLELASVHGEHSAALHAVLAPSAAHRWVNCPGSVQAEQQYPDIESEPAREGTACHEIGAAMVEAARTAGTLIWAHFDGKTASNGVMFNQEMYEAAELYADDIRQVMTKADIFSRQLLRIEKPVTIPRVHDLNWGTPDCVIWDLKNGVLYVWDFKYGYGVVEVEQNWQLIEYALGALDSVTAGNGFEDQHITIDMRIVQPRAFHPDGPCRSWRVPASDLRSHANQLTVAAEASQSESPPCKAGTWCDHCKAAADCGTLQHATADTMDRIEVLQLHDLTPEASAIELRYLERSKVLLDAKLEALQAQSLQQVKDGTVIPGYGIGYGRGSTNWNKPDSEVIALGDLMGVDLRKAEKPVTPSQALKLNVDETVINSYSQKRQGLARLVTNDKTIAGRVFSNN